MLLQTFGGSSETSDLSVGYAGEARKRGSGPPRALLFDLGATHWNPRFEEHGMRWFVGT